MKKILLAAILLALASCEPVFAGFADFTFTNFSFTCTCTQALFPVLWQDDDGTVWQDDDSTVWGEL